MAFTAFGRTGKSRRNRPSRQQRRAFLFESLEARLPLSVTVLEVEDNDTLGTAQAIVHPGLAAGVVDSWTPGMGASIANVTDNDPDFFKFSASVAGELRIAVRNLAGDPNNDGVSDDDLQVTVRNNADVIITGPTALSAAGAPFSFAIAGVNTTDVYKVTVEGANATQDADYQLRVWNLDGNDDAGSNNNIRADATPITITGGAGTATNNTITRPDRDYYKITSDVTGMLEVRATMPATTGTPTGPTGPTNLGIRVRDVNGVIISTSNGTVSNVDLASFSAVNGEMYFIEVYSGSVGQVNRYDLDIGQPSGQLSGFKFNDLNADGFQDFGEPGLQNWVIFDDVIQDGILNNSNTANNGVCDANALEPCELTAADGSYSMTLSAGVHEIREVPQAGWFQSYPGVEDGGFHTINITASTLLDHIDFGNYLAATVTVTKDALPDHAQDFEFDPSDNLDLNNFFLDDDADGTLSNTRVFGNLMPGTYTVQEVNLPAGWALTDLQITGDTDNGSTINLGTGLATLDVDPGENITVTFTDTKLSSITLIKDAIPNDAQDFEFDPSTGLAAANFFLDDDADGTLSNTRLFNNLLPGSYTLQEVNLPAGWTLGNIVITGDTDNGSSVNIVTGLATIDVDAGEDITVTYENIKLGTVNVIKDAIPDDAQDFSYTGDLGAFDLDDDADGTLSNTATFINLTPGSFMVTETAVGGWDVTAINIVGDTDGGSTVDLVNRKVTIDVDPGEVITVTFENTKRGTVNIVKDAIPNDAQDFSFSGDLGTFSLDDDADGTLSNTATFNNVVPGSLMVTEGALTGWDLTAINIAGDTDGGSTVDLANRKVTIDLDPGENITVTFENTKRGSITVVKDAIPDDAQDFGYTGDLGVFALDDDADGTLPNTQAFANLVPGSFMITEDMIAGWAVTDIVITGDTDGGSTIDVANRKATIDVDPGENITVTFENTKVSAVTIVKDAVPNDAQDFAFTGGFGAFSLDDDADGTLSNSAIFNNLLPGNRTVTETAVIGWDVTNIQITGDTDGGSTIDIPNRQIVIDVDAGENITVTFTNTKRGTVTVVKNAIPDDAQDFSFSGGLGAFMLDDDADGTLSNTANFINVVPGSIAVTEAAVAGWDLTNIQFAGDTDGGSTFNLATGIATIDLDPGENITVTFENSKRGSITVVKDAVPNDAQDFSFSGGLGNFSLDDDADGTLPNNVTFGNLVAGGFSVTEGALAGWDLTGIQFVGDTDGGSTIDLSNGIANIDLDPGENITVTFQNTKRGSITVIKDAVPDDVQDFAYTGDLGAFSLDDDADGTLPNTQAFPNLVPGSFMITEGMVIGWTNTNIVISGDTDGGSTIDLPNRKATIDLDPGENITVTFENTKGAAVTIVKDSVPDDPQDFSYSGGLGNFQLDDDADGTLPNSQTFTPAPGSYLVTEAAVAGWDLTNLQITGDTDGGSVIDIPNRQVTIDVDAGEIITVTYTNTKRGSIKVIKDADPDHSQDFAFTGSGGIGAFSLDDDADGTLPNMQTFGDLAPGTYTITEGITAGWDLTSIVIVDPDGGSSFNLGTGTATLDVDPGEDITITFLNEITPAFDGRKFHDLNTNGNDDSGSDPSLAGWTIQLYQDDGDGTFEPGPFGLPGQDTLIDSDVTDANGNYRLADQGLASGTYFVREVQQSGWHQTTSPLVYTVNYVSGSTSTNDFGNAQCNQINTGAGDSTHTVTATQDGILTLQLDGGLFEVWDAANSTPIYVYHFEQGADRVAGNDGDDNNANGTPNEFIEEPGGESSESVLEPGVQRADVLTTMGTTYTIRVFGANAASVLRYLNAVNVDIAGTLALQIEGTACGDLIAVGDDTGGGSSDAKAIFIGAVNGTINGGVDLTATGFNYRTAIIDAMFGMPTISRVEINGNDGDDQIRVTDDIVQQSTLNGGAGNDNLRGGAGKATVFGGAGHDLMVGGGADDVLIGGDGDDALIGLAGADRAFGGNGNDSISGGADNDALLRGGNGDDSISGGAGGDRLLGDAGSDVLYRDAADLLVSGGTPISTPPDPLDDALQQLIDDYWLDTFVTDGDDDASLDTLDELIDSILP